METQEHQQQQYLNGENEELDLYFPTMQQSSIYPITEVENTVWEPGTPFGSMDMDDFLSSIWSTEEDNITMTSAAATVVIPATNNIVVATTSAHAPLQQQVSISHPGSSSHQRNPDNVHDIKSEPEDMSIEDFLVQTGVVREAKHSSVLKPPMELAVHGVQQLGIVGSSLSPITPDGFRLPNFSSNSGSCGGGMVAGGSSRGRRRRGAVDGGTDWVAERNQRRMIKNRESAARSRARKQAYTAELEAEQNKMREENARLREDVRLEKRKTADFMEERSREKTVKVRRTHRPNVSCQ